ncbi:hypothetical protein [Rivularia sp. UHCC 0363]|uniref:hypothetical protein n=1 Tax=Rivularia sp. UHCC 0363 TaxID=3110244 RepID=UPI002B1EABFD|nr:hypothetical protein [Rivularia sp. UHCC 0363]MEA5596314.1 hypothetical protein [Rivularia sp. UHCC 0363]
MKLKKLSLFAGAIAVAFSITPLAANAQVNSNNAPKISQARPQSAPELKLSQQQINKINQIRSSTRDKIQNVLTKEQRQQIQSDLQAGKQPQQVFASIQFTKQQEAQLQTIMVGSQKEMEGVLDAQQKKTLEAWRAAQRSQTQKK